MPWRLSASVEHDVQWNDGNLETLPGQSVWLYIMVQDADLYGFRFRWVVSWG